MYNLSFDTYYNLTLNNISSLSKNNHNCFSNYKLSINSVSNTVYYYTEYNNYSQSVMITDKNISISKLDIMLTDRYNNILTSNLDCSITLEYEFY